MQFKNRKEEGMTLIELLAAITILAIVFIGILTLFPRMTAVNLQTEEKLETMNLAKVELNELQGENGKEQLLTYSRTAIDGGYLFTVQKNGYTYNIIYYTTPQLEKECESAPQTELYKIHITVLVGEKEISEIFGYVTYEI